MLAIICRFLSISNVQLQTLNDFLSMSIFSTMVQIPLEISLTPQRPYHLCKQVVSSIWAMCKS